MNYCHTNRCKMDWTANILNPLLSKESSNDGMALPLGYVYILWLGGFVPATLYFIYLFLHLF